MGWFRRGKSDTRPETLTGADAFLRDVASFLSLRREHLATDYLAQSERPARPEVVRVVLSVEVALLLLHLRQFLSAKHFTNNEEAERDLFKRVLDVAMRHAPFFPFDPDLVFMIFAVLQSEWLKAGRPSAVNELAMRAYSEEEHTTVRSLITKAAPFVDGLMTYFRESRDY